VQSVQSEPTPSPKLDAIAAKIEALIDMPLVRYPLAALVLWLAYYASQEWGDWRRWIVVLSAVFWSLWLARELFGWLFGIAVVGGIAWAFFAGVAALPISAAIVVGAIIIALAVRR
jgi:hypothetical protein